MKCEMCHRNDAKVAIHLSTGGKERELYVCRDCADKEKGRRHQPRHKFGQSSLDDEDEDSDVLDRGRYRSRWFSDGDDGDGEAAAGHRHWTLSEDVAPCPDCGTTVEDIEHSGLLGCPYCYTAFRDVLERNVRMRGTFGGKQPNGRAGDAPRNGGVMN